MDDVVILDGYKFRKDKKTGYYLSSVAINGKRKRLHIYVWERENGTIPKGYQIHHIDHNKDNNSIENLEMLTSKEHTQRHIEERTDEQREQAKENVVKYAMPKAKEWHTSESGKEWHLSHYEKMKDKLHQKADFICECCGKSFTAEITGKNRFCSNNCKSAYRRKSGVDNIEKECKFCGDKFVTNKYSKAIRCKNCKGKKSCA